MHGIQGFGRRSQTLAQLSRTRMRSGRQSAETVTGTVAPAGQRSAGLPAWRDESVQLASRWPQEREDVLEVGRRARSGSESRGIQGAAFAGEEREADEAATDLEACGNRSPARWRIGPAMRATTLEPLAAPPAAPIATCSETITPLPDLAASVSPRPHRFADADFWGTPIPRVLRTFCTRF
jgi:hypothetical protein